MLVTECESKFTAEIRKMIDATSGADRRAAILALAALTRACVALANEPAKLPLAPLRNRVT